MNLLFIAYIAVPLKPPTPVNIVPREAKVKVYAQVPVLSAPIDLQAAPIRLNFSKTDVGQIFRIIGLRAGVSIIYSSSDDNKVTIHLEANNAEEAVRGVAAAGGLSYRKIGRVYIVAKPDAMKQALEPYKVRLRIDVSGDAADIAKKVGDAVPQATVVPLDGAILVLGVEEDTLVAQQMARFLDKTASKSAIVTETLSPQIIATRQLLAFFRALDPKGERIRAIQVAGREDAVGTVALIGTEADVAWAKQLAEGIDRAAPESDRAVYVSYDVKFSDAITLRNFLRQAAPDVEPIMAPASYSPTVSQVANATVIGATPAGNSGGGLGNSGPGNQTSGGGGGSPTQPQGAGGSGGAGGGTEGADTAAATQGAGTTDPGAAAASNPAYLRSKRIILKGRKADVDAALLLLERVDRQPQQVMVSVQVIDTSPEALRQAGITWTWNPLQFFDFPAGTGLKQDAPTPILVDTTTRPVGIGQFSRVPLSFMGVVDAMIQNRTAKLLANPSVQVIDGENANIFIGDTYQIVNSTSSVSGTTENVIKFDVGIGLALRPRVNSDGYVTMSVNPQVATVTAIVDGLPQTASRQAQTTVMIKDGETLMIGGLIRDEDIKVAREVPLLAKLPFFGQLFRDNSVTKRHSNVIVLITPRIVKDTTLPAATPTTAPPDPVAPPEVKP